MGSSIGFKLVSLGEPSLHVGIDIRFFGDLDFVGDAIALGEAAGIDQALRNVLALFDEFGQAGSGG